MGAAIATVICYSAVFLIRVIDTRKYINFDRAAVKTVVNSVAIFAQVVLMVLDLPFWWIYQICFVCLLVVFNGKDLVHSVLSVLKRKKI